MKRSHGRRAERAAHHGEAGLTLTELLVTIAVLAVIGGSIAGAFAIGLRILSPGGAQASLTGNHDLLSFEQQLGADLARADCLAAPGQTTLPTAGCSNSVRGSPSSCGSGYSICLAWYVPGSTTCHTITYTQQSSTGAILRTDNSSAAASGRFTTGGLVVTATWTPATTTNNGYQWTRQVTVSVTQAGAPGAASKPVHTTFNVAPLVADPASPVVAGGTVPC